MTIAEVLKQKGYSTAIFGKWHLGSQKAFLPLQNGFDEYYGLPYSNDMWPFHPQQGEVFNFPDLPTYDGNEIIGYNTDQTRLTTDYTTRSVNFIKKNKNKPFFLYLAHNMPHVPLAVSDKFKGKSEQGLYGDVMMEIDWSVGEIFKALRELGLEDNTLVILTSDNGPWTNYGNHAGSAGGFREAKATTSVSYTHLENERLSMILTRLEPWFGRKIKCPKEIAEKYRFTFKVRDESLERILFMLSNTSPIKYREKDNEYELYIKGDK